jgi:hypothetical protein
MDILYYKSMIVALKVFCIIVKQLGDTDECNNANTTLWTYPRSWTLLIEFES